MQRILASIVALGLGLWAAPAALADSAPADSLLAQPSSAAVGSHLVIDAKGAGAGFGAGYPLGVVLALFKGFALDLAAASRCGEADAGAGTCPPTSQVATGTVAGSASVAGLLSQPVSAPVGVFLAGAHNGDLADVVVEVSPQGSPPRTTRGALVGVSDPVFGYELRLDPLPDVMAPLGTTLTLSEFKLDIGASATAPGTTRPPSAAPRPRRCRHGRAHGKCRRPRHKHSRRRASRAATVTHDLITNPPSCAGSWPAQLRVRYADHTQALDAAIACSP